jgi:hypothetical protein
VVQLKCELSILYDSGVYMSMNYFFSEEWISPKCCGHFASYFL